MLVVIICFSQTGNTRTVAEAMAGVFQDAGHPVRTVPLKNATPADAAAGELLGVGTPCFGSQAPTPVKKFLRSLPRLENRRGFVFATSNEAPGRVLYDQTLLLRSKGVGAYGVIAA